ncbi:hypothetical protein [Micromonospora sp. NPDC023814]|uniref:hypothetical protein n=1 Tax=Micromonospora sp. NPDC023814 TaxID=3154596 RepID=UPI0033C176B5
MSRVPKVLIAAAGVTGVVAYGLPQPWSLVAAVADLLLVGLAGGLRLRAGRNRDVLLRHRIEPSETRWYPQARPPGGHEEPSRRRGATRAGASYGPPQSDSLPLAQSRSKRRLRWLSSTVREIASSTSRVRRWPKTRPSTFLTSAPDPVPPPPAPPGPAPDVHQRLVNLETLVRTTNERGQRAQWWFFLAGVAVSIPAGVVVNLLTG